MRVLLPAIGQSYEHPDIPLSAQSTKNWFPEINQESQTVLSLQPYPGTKTFSSKAGIDRGMTVWGNQLYKVTDKALYSVNTVGVQTSIGTIDGVGRCTFPASATILVIVTSGFVYQYDGNTLSEITDVDLEIPNYAAYLNNQWIYQGSRARFCVSEAGQPANINGLNYASAESEGDDLVRPYVFNQILYLFGEKNTEAWYNSGQGRPPFDRVDGGIIQKGLGAADSLDNNDQSMIALSTKCQDRKCSLYRRYLYRLCSMHMKMLAPLLDFVLTIMVKSFIKSQYLIKLGCIRKTAAVGVRLLTAQKRLHRRSVRMQKFMAKS